MILSFFYPCNKWLQNIRYIHRRIKMSLDTYVKKVGIEWIFIGSLIRVCRSKWTVRIIHRIAPIWFSHEAYFEKVSHLKIFQYTLTHTLSCALQKVFEPKSFPHKFNHSIFEYKIHSIEVDLYYFKYLYSKNQVFWTLFTYRSGGAKWTAGSSELVRSMFLDIQILDLAIWLWYKHLKTPIN